MWALLAALAAAGPVDQVAHRGAWSEGEVHWEGRWRADQAVDRLEFAAPLPRDAQLVEADGEAVRDGVGRITALAFDPPRAAGSWQLVLQQPTEAPALAVPLVADPAVQQVTVVGRDFEPAEALGYEKHVRYWAPTALAGPEERRFQRNRKAGGWRASLPDDQPVYVRADPRLVAAGGIPGRLLPEDQVSWGVHGLLGLALVGLLGFGAALYRGLEAAARAERNSAYIRENFGEET